MSIEKQKLYNEIETLPEELTNQVINFIEYLKISYIDAEAPDSITIKSKKDLKDKKEKEKTKYFWGKYKKRILFFRNVSVCRLWFRYVWDYD